MKMFLTLLVVALAVTMCAAAQAVATQENLRRELASAFPTPTGWLAFTDYLDASCTQATGYASVIGGGMCVTYKTAQSGVQSYVNVATTSGNTVTITPTRYTAYDCAGTGVAGTAVPYTINTCALKTGQTAVWQKTTSLATAPASPAGSFTQAFYTTQANCDSSPLTSFTSAVVQTTNACIKTGDATSSYTDTSSITASVQDYSDATCSTKNGDAVPYFLRSCDVNALDMELTDDSKEVLTYAVSAAPVAAKAAKVAACFASSETVQLQDGSIKALSEVQLGDRVLTATLEGSLKGFSPVIAVPHRGQEQTAATFVQLATEASDVKMTPDHMVLAGSCSPSSPLALVQARSVSVGDCLQTAAGKAPVTATKMVQGKGIASAVTQAGGLIVVNGIAASPFAVNHRVGEAWYVIHRALFAVLPAALGWSLLQKTSETFGDLAVQASM